MFGLAVNPKREQNGDGGTDKIRKVAPEDLPEISSALSRAFFDDPLSARGGRLVMRLLAVTAEPTARDRALRPTRGGPDQCGWNARFIVFTGLSFPSAYLICGADYSAGRTAGVAFGALLRVLAGTRLEPLRPGTRI
jgi:hypothetical protein